MRQLLASDAISDNFDFLGNVQHATAVKPNNEMTIHAVHYL
jgi:hypothetical protein